MNVSQTIDIKEGKARLRLTNATGTHGVFYNPKMSLNRDVAVLFASSHFPVWRRLRICDPMTASAVRAVRYVTECSNVVSVTAADADPVSVQSATSTVDLNSVGQKVSVVQAEANTFLTSHSTDRFDLVELDPYGSPAPFFESALRATIDRGVLASSATDMAPLTGARPSACFRKYGVRPVRVEFEKEVAIRILAGNLAITAGKLELGVKIVFSHASDHYARIYAEVRKGKKEANESMKSLGFLSYCPTCLRRMNHSSLEGIEAVCEDCRSKLRIGGPYWFGSLWNISTVDGMIEGCSTLESSRLGEVQNLLSRIRKEADAPPSHYRIDIFSHILHIRPPKIDDVLARLRERGYSAVRTHFHANGFRTNAPNCEIISVMRSFDET